MTAINIKQTCMIILVFIRDCSCLLQFMHVEQSENSAAISTFSFTLINAAFKLVAIYSTFKSYTVTHIYLYLSSCKRDRHFYNLLDYVKRENFFIKYNTEFTPACKLCCCILG